jgi:hypothetical protein
MSRSTDKRWLFTIPSNNIQEYLRRTFDDLAEHLLDLEKRVSSGDTVTSSELASVAETVGTLQTTVASLETQSNQTVSRVVTLGIGDLDIAEGQGLLMFDGENITGTVNNDGVIVCI